MPALPRDWDQMLSDLRILNEHLIQHFGGVINFRSQHPQWQRSYRWNRQNVMIAEMLQMLNNERNPRVCAFLAPKPQPTYLYTANKVAGLYYRADHGD